MPSFHSPSYFLPSILMELNDSNPGLPNVDAVAAALVVLVLPLVVPAVRPLIEAFAVHVVVLPLS